LTFCLLYNTVTVCSPFGNLGDAKTIGGGVYEARIFYGPGYRLYFVNKAGNIIILLCGGDKSTQAEDIRQAREMAREV
jgi:putative addiction module killer protein